MLRKILGMIAIALGVLVVVAFLLPRHVHVERVIVVDRPSAAVFPLVNSLRRFNEWSPWADLDPNAKVTFSGPETGVGARMEWAGNDKVGSGSEEITASSPERQVAVDLDFGSQRRALAAFTLRPDPGGTRVAWSLDMDVGNNPVGRYMGLFMGHMVGGDYERGLDRLKALAEHSPPPEPAQPTSATVTSSNAPTS